MGHFSNSNRNNQMPEHLQTYSILPYTLTITLYSTTDSNIIRCPGCVQPLVVEWTQAVLRYIGRQLVPILLLQQLIQKKKITHKVHKFSQTVHVEENISVIHIFRYYCFQNFSPIIHLNPDQPSFVVDSPISSHVLNA